MFWSPNTFNSGPAAGVVGTLPSATVSRLGPFTLVPRAGALVVVLGGVSSLSVSFWWVETGTSAPEVAFRLKEFWEGPMSDSDFRNVGIELRVFSVPGGGDLSLGDMGQCGELSPDLVGLSDRELSRTPSTLAGCIVGLFADKAR